MRVCPLCNSTTEASHCARDGTATIRVVTQAPPGLPRIGDVIAGRYRIEGALGAGGFGAVYRVTHTGTGQACALKVLVLSGDQHQQSMRRFYAEARVTAGLQHVNTVRVFDFGQDDRGWYFLAMELLVGRTLAQWLSERRARLQVMSQGEAVHVAVSVLRSLTEAHGAGLVHRDLKPHNIFLQSVAGDEPTVKVLDFGIAKSAEFALTLNDQALGTPLYMSPEQCLSEPIDGRADLYSLGCLLFQMVTGAPPFKGNSVAAIVLQQVSNPAPDVAALARTEVSADFAAVIERALLKAPAERFSSALEMREALRPCARPHRWELGPLPESADGATGAAEPLEHGTTSDAGILGRPTAQPQVNNWLATAVQPHRAISAERSTPVAVDATAFDGQGLPASYTVAVEAPGAARATPAAGTAGVTAGYAELPSPTAESPPPNATPPAQAPTVATPTALPGATREQLATTTDFSATKTAGLPTAAMPRPEGAHAEGDPGAPAPSARPNAAALVAAAPRSRGTTAVAAAATAVALALGMGWAMQRQSSGAPAGLAPELPGSAGAEPVARPVAAAAAAVPHVAGVEGGAPGPAPAAPPSAAITPTVAAVPAVVPAPAAPDAQPSAEQKQQAAAGRAAPRLRKAADKGAEPAAAPPPPAPAAAPAAPAPPAPAKEDRL